MCRKEGVNEDSDSHPYGYTFNFSLIQGAIFTSYVTHCVPRFLKTLSAFKVTAKVAIAFLLCGLCHGQSTFL